MARLQLSWCKVEGLPSKPRGDLTERRTLGHTGRIHLPHCSNRWCTGPGCLKGTMSWSRMGQVWPSGQPGHRFMHSNVPQRWHCRPHFWFTTAPPPVRSEAFRSSGRDVPPFALVASRAVSDGREQALYPPLPSTTLGRGRSKESRILPRPLPC